MRLIAFIALLALGCTQRADDILVDADQGDAGTFKKRRLDAGVDKTPLDAGGEVAGEMPGVDVRPVEGGSEAVPEAPGAEVPPSACAGKAEGDVCGAESCSGTIAMHHRCKSGACVAVSEDCYKLYCVNSVTFVVGTCGCVGEKCRCFAPVSTGMDCPVGQTCTAITPVVPDGAKGACVAVADGGSTG